MWKCRKISHHFCPVPPMEASFSLILCWSPKKKVLRLSSATFLRDFCDIPEWGAVNRGCLRFLAGEKTPEFAKFQCENAGKNFALFALFCAYREHCLSLILTLTQTLTLMLTLIPTLALTLTQTLTQTEEKHYFASRGKIATSFVSRKFLSTFLLILTQI